MLIPPLHEYQNEARRICSLLVYHILVTNMNEGETPLSINPRKKRFAIKPE